MFWYIPPSRSSRQWHQKQHLCVGHRKIGFRKPVLVRSVSSQSPIYCNITRPVQSLNATYHLKVCPRSQLYRVESKLLIDSERLWSYGTHSIGRFWSSEYILYLPMGVSSQNRVTLSRSHPVWAFVCLCMFACVSGCDSVVPYPPFPTTHSPIILSYHNHHHRVIDRKCPLFAL